MQDIIAFLISMQAVYYNKIARFTCIYPIKNCIENLAKVKLYDNGGYNLTYTKRHCCFGLLNNDFLLIQLDYNS